MLESFITAFGFPLILKDTVCNRYKLRPTPSLSYPSFQSIKDHVLFSCLFPMSFESSTLFFGGGTLSVFDTIKNILLLMKDIYHFFFYISCFICSINY